MTLHLHILPRAQAALWTELSSLPPHFVLYGGTALALRLGHRTSIDFDFFTEQPLDHKTLQQLSILSGATTLQEERDTLTVTVDRGAPVKVSFFGAIDFGRIGVPDIYEVPVASQLDLAGTKIKALLQRIEAKDYIDIAALIRSGTSLADILAAGRALFGAAFNPMMAQKTLCYFDEGDLAVQLDTATRSLLTQEASRELALPRLQATHRTLR